MDYLFTQWVDNLKSGRFAQAQGVLRDGDSYCCLGVLCDTIRQNYGGVWTKDEHNNYFFVFDTEAAQTQLSEDLLDLVDLTDDQQADLIAMNDSGVSFLDIATALVEMKDNVEVNY